MSTNTCTSRSSTSTATSTTSTIGTSTIHRRRQASRIRTDMSTRSSATGIHIIPTSTTDTVIRR